jgi:uncharacterized protein YceK
MFERSRAADGWRPDQYKEGDRWWYASTRLECDDSAGSTLSITPFLLEWQSDTQEAANDEITALQGYRITHQLCSFFFQTTNIHSLIMTLHAAKVQYSTLDASLPRLGLSQNEWVSFHSSASPTSLDLPLSFLVESHFSKARISPPREAAHFLPTG